MDVFTKVFDIPVNIAEPKNLWHEGTIWRITGNVSMKVWKFNNFEIEVITLIVWLIEELCSENGNQKDQERAFCKLDKMMI